MSKKRYTMRLRRTMTAVIVLVGLALFCTIVVQRSTAQFTDQSDNPGNLFKTGTITLTNNKADSAVVNAVGLVPGGSASGTLVIGVTGSYTARVTLTGTTDKSGLAQALSLRIEDVTGTPTTLWTGTLSTLSSLTLGNMAPGSSRSYRFTITLPSTAPPTAMNDSTSETLTFTGVAQ